MPTFVSDVVLITSFNVLNGYVYVSHSVKFDKFRYTGPFNSLLKALTTSGKKITSAGQRTRRFRSQALRKVSHFQMLGKFLCMNSPIDILTTV